MATSMAPRSESGAVLSEPVKARTAAASTRTGSTCTGLDGLTCSGATWTVELLNVQSHVSPGRTFTVTAPAFVGPL